MELRPEDDRGWNDPPVVNFTETIQGHKRGKLLTKRVAFPINGSVGGPTMGGGYPSMQPPMNAHNMQPGPFPLQVGQESYAYGTQGGSGEAGYYPRTTESFYPQPPQAEYSNPNPNQTVGFMPSGPVEQPQPIQYRPQNVHQSVPQAANDSMLHLDEAIKNFHDLMNKLSPEIVNKDEVSRLLQIMQSMWREYKLIPEVQDMILQISIALINCNRSYAESLLSSLNANHFEISKEWIMGPRALLQALTGQPTWN